MPTLKANIGGVWTPISSGGGGAGADEMFIGPNDPGPTYELWYDTDAPATNAPASQVSSTPTGWIAATNVQAAIAEIAAEAAQAALLGVWGSYTPVVTASTTNPNLGSTPTVTGKYCQIGKLVFWRVYVGPSGTGISAGSGNYSISLPPIPLFTTSQITAYGWIYGVAGFKPLVADGSPSRLIMTTTGGYLTHAEGLGASGHIIALAGQYEAS